MQFRCPQVPLAHRMFLVLSLVALLTLFGPQVPSAAAQSSAFVRVIHASPYVGTADVFLDGTKLLSSFAFGAVTDYVPLPPGPHKVQIALVGKGIGAAALSQTLAVSPGVTYTVAAIGATPTSLSLEVFVDDNLLTPGSAKVRVYHLSPDVGPISVSTGGNTLISGIIYQQASKYLAIAPASYTFAVDATQVNTSLPLAATLKANMVTSIFAVGMVNGSPKLELVPAQADGLPGLPGTGSDPHLPAPGVQPLTPWFPWLAGALVLGMLGARVMIRRRAGGR